MIIRFLTITLLFVFIAIGTIGGCGGSGGEGGIIVVDDFNIIERAEISFSAAAVRFAIDNLSFNPDLTFDEPEFNLLGPAVDGLSTQGVTFFFTVFGDPSPDAAVGLDIGPGDTPLITPPIIEGDATGLLTLIFDPPVEFVEFDFALDVVLEDIPDAVTVNLFDDNNNNIFGIPLITEAIVPDGFVFPEGSFFAGIFADMQQFKELEKNDPQSPSQQEPSDLGDFDTGW